MKEVKHDGAPLSISPSRVIVVTLKGRAYYKILEALRAIDIDFVSSTPEELNKMHLGSSLIITTKEERDAIEHDNILLDTDLEKDPAVIKAKILNTLSNSSENILLIGIDPGKRIGLSILYMHEEIASRVLTSTDALIELLDMLIDDIDADKTIVKIGSGDRNLALKIAYMLSRESLEIELVDEHGTTSSITDASSRRRGVRDRLSARAIAYRRGTNFKEYISYTRY